MYIQESGQTNGLTRMRSTPIIIEQLAKNSPFIQDSILKDVQKNMSLIRSPAAGLKERHAKEAAQQAAMMDEDDDDENIQYVDAKQLERQ